MKYNLARSEYKQLASLVKNSIPINQDRFGEELRRVPLKKFNHEKLDFLCNQYICHSYTYDNDQKYLEIDFSYEFMKSDLYKSMQLMDHDIVKALKTESALKLYGYFELNSKVVDNKREKTISLEELRDIFECAPGKYTQYKDLRVRKINPAIKDLEKAGYYINYHIVKVGRKVEFIKIFRELTVDEVNKINEMTNSSKVIDIKSDCVIQEAIGRLTGCLYNYSSNLGASPKNVEEYILDFRSSMIITNRPNKDKDANCVRVRVYRSDVLMNKTPIYVYVEIEDNELVYKIRFEEEHKIKGKIKFECTVKTEYEVIVALENIKQGILQGIELSDIKIDNEMALHAPLNPTNDVEDMFDRYIPCENLMRVIDEVNKNVEDAFIYVYEVSFYTRDFVRLMSIKYKNNLWSVQLLRGGRFMLSEIVKDGYTVDNIQHKDIIMGLKEENSQYPAMDIVEVFKIVCGEDINDAIIKTIEETVSTFEES